MLHIGERVHLPLVRKLTYFIISRRLFLDFFSIFSSLSNFYSIYFISYYFSVLFVDEGVCVAHDLLADAVVS